MTDDWPDPSSAGDAAEFVGALRQLRTRADMSYRALERRAAAAGEALPSSTVSGALSRDTLPRADLVAAFVRACGGDDATIQLWLAARARLAAAEVQPPAPRPAASPPPASPSPASSPPVPAPETDTDAESGVIIPEISAVPANAEEPPKEEIPVAHIVPPTTEAAGMRRRVQLVAVAIVALALVVAGGLVALNGSGNSPADSASPGSSVPTSTPVPPSVAPPPPESTVVNASGQKGKQPVRVAHTGLCLGEGMEKVAKSRRTVIGQQPCETASPPISVEPEGNVYRLVLHHPTYGDGCVTVDYGGTDMGLLLAGDACEDKRPDQQFTFERVAAPVAGYRLRSVAGAQWCIGVFRGSKEPGMQLIQDPCDGSAAQVFTLELPGKGPGA